MTTDAALALETRALRMLRAGDDAKSIRQATGLTYEQIAKLAADFPGPNSGKAQREASDLARDGAPPAPALAAVPDPSTRLTGDFLLETASKHSNPRVRKAGERVQAQLDLLRGLIDRYADDDRRRREAAEAKEKTRAEVARLERQLREAKARLRGKPATSATPRAAKPAGEFPCRKGCGKVSPNPQGRAAHERHCQHTTS